MTVCKEKLTIFIIAETYPPEINGAARFGQRLAEGLSKRGHDIYVIAPCHDKGKSIIISNHGVTEYRLKSHSVITHPDFRLCFIWQIKHLMKQFFAEKCPDIIHIQSHFSLGRLAVEIARERNIPVVATVHVIPENIAPFIPLPGWIKRRFIAYLCRDAAYVLSKVNVVTAPTELAIKHLNKNITTQGIIPVSNGIDPALYVLKESDSIKKKNNPTVLFVGRLAQEKNVDVLIKAMSKIPASLNVSLEIIGEGEILDDLYQLVDQLNISHRVKFLGYVDDEILRQAYIQASIFCMPGIAELQSLATLEAMSASLPVILANSLALPHLVTENRNGYLFNPGDSDDLANKIKHIILLSKEARDNMGKESRKLVSAHHLDKTLSIYETIYNEQITQRHSKTKY